MSQSDIKNHRLPQSQEEMEWMFAFAYQSATIAIFREMQNAAMTAALAGRKWGNGDFARYINQQLYEAETILGKLAPNINTNKDSEAETESVESPDEVPNDNGTDGLPDDNS